MRTEQKLRRMEQQVADRRVNQILSDLSHWTEEEIDAAMWAIENEPQTPEFQAFRERLRTLTNEELIQEHQRTLQQMDWPKGTQEGYCAL